jgi:hypothetical protein
MGLYWMLDEAPPWVAPCSSDRSIVQMLCTTPYILPCRYAATTLRLFFVPILG